MLSKLHYCFHSTCPGGMADAYGQLTQSSKRYVEETSKQNYSSELPAQHSSEPALSHISVATETA